MALSPGNRLGPYEIVAPLGAGGMGEVYLARDSRLGREVAIKALPDALAADQERLARFEREAKVLASLNHSGVGAIYGLEEADGHRYLVLEYVQGETLASRLKRGAIPLDEALPLAKQIAEALEAAHEKGIVHRDLKPANVMVTDEGHAKVLDFGLARSAESMSFDPDSPTVASPAHSPTIAGVIMGTAGYMSPEQARGKIVDKRSDIFSFGCVVFEMLTGNGPFGGETVTDALGAVLHREPDWSLLPEATPPALEQLLTRCLVKDKNNRLRDIGDARIEIESAIATPSGPALTAGARAATPHTAGIREGVAWLLVALLVIVAGLSWRMSTRGAAGTMTGPIRLSFSIPPAIHAASAGITVDGRTLIVGGLARKPDGTDEPRGRIYARRLDDYEFTSIAGTEGVQSLTQSPDGKWLAFIATVSEQSTQRRIAKVPVDGSSPPVALSDWDDDWNTNVVWLEDGDLLVSANRGTKFFRLPTKGGAAKPPMAVDTGSIGGSPVFGRGLPGDRGVFFTMESWGSRGYQLDQWLLDPATGKARRLFESAGNAIYVPTGHIVFSRGPVLMAAPFELGQLAVTGDVTALPGSVRTVNSWSNGEFTLSNDGTLVFAPGGRLGTDRTLVTIDASGRVTRFAADARSFETPPRISRDGRSVAVVISNAKGTYETWVAEADRPGLTRVLVLPNADCAGPVWAPDAQRLVYDRTARDKDDGIYLQRADGTGSPQAILKEESPEVNFLATSWSPDGSGIIVTKSVGGKSDMLFVPISAAGGASTPRVLRANPSNEAEGRFSPDGRLVAFSSDESGGTAVYVAGYGADGSLGPAAMVSNGGGGLPRWAADGHRLFFNRADKVMSVAISVTPKLTASAPVVAYDLKTLRVNSSEWDIMPDGRLLAIQKGEGEDDITVFNVVLNWFDELRARMTRRG